MSSPFDARVCSVLAALFAFIGLTVAPGSATIGVSPLRIEVQPGAVSSSIDVTNRDSFDRTLRVEAFHWRHGDEIDRAKADDLLVSPPILAIKAGETRTIRMGLAVPNRSADEVAYRVFLTEVHSEVGSGLAVAVDMRVSIPVFLVPANPSKSKPQWIAKRDGSRSVALTLKDTSAFHVHVTTLRAKDSTGALGSMRAPTYVLPGDSHTWTVPLERAPGAQGLTVEAVTDSGVVSVPVAEGA